MSKLDTIGQCQQLFFAVQEGQLAAIAGGELHDRNGRLMWFSHGFFHALEILDLKKSLGYVVGDDRAIFAKKQRTPLAVATVSDTALHVAFHREPNGACGDSEFPSALGAAVHHDFGSAQEDLGPFRAEIRVVQKRTSAIEQVRHISDRPGPGGFAWRVFNEHRT